MACEGRLTFLENVAIMFSMTDAPANAEPNAAASPTKGCMRCGNDAAGERAARRLARADELAQMGMDVARVLRHGCEKREQDRCWLL